MKRIFTLILASALLTALPASAATWFPDGDFLHIDPLCPYNDFSVDSCFAQTVTLTVEEAVNADRIICNHCFIDAPGVSVSSADIAVTWYHNPDGGSYLHRDPDCPSVSEKYKPMAVKLTAADPDYLPDNACRVCGSAPARLTYLFAHDVWGSSPEKKAELLPGVWTLPSANAIPEEEAVAIAKEEVRKYSDREVHTALALHYDHDPQGSSRESWYVVVSTPLMHPVCVVYIDALTGAIYGVALSDEYSDPAQATGAQVEILADNVNLRQTPGGDLIGRLQQGETLTLLGEGRQGLSLSYRVYSPTYGEGYVRSTFAQIIHNGQLRGSGSALTGNTVEYCAALRRWQIENGFLARDSSGEFVYTRDKSLDTPQAQAELVALMEAHGVTALNGADPAYVLSTHYGYTRLWGVFDPASEILPGLHVNDWHSPDQPTAEERQRLADALASVDASFD